MSAEDTGYITVSVPDHAKMHSLATVFSFYFFVTSYKRTLSSLRSVLSSYKNIGQHSRLRLLQ